MQPRLLDRRSAAAYCGVSVNHFLDEIAAHVPPVQVGTKKLWDVRTIDRWIDQLDSSRRAEHDGWDEAMDAL